MTDKARILYITYNGAGESIFQSQCLPYLKGLAAKGYRITLITYERDDRAYPDCREIFSSIGIGWIRLRYHKAPRLIVTAYDFLLGIFVTCFAVLSKKIDIVHARATHGAVIGAPAAKIFGRKFIFDTRGLDSEEYADAGLISVGSMLHKVLSGLERILFSASDAIVLLSQNSKSLLTEKGLGKFLENKPTYVIPCVTDLELFKVKARESIALKALKLIYIGSIGTWYMLDEMLDFFSVLKQNSPDSKFLIFTQSEKRSITRKVKELGLENSIDVSYISHGSIPGAIAGADIGISFIKPVSSKRASSPTKIGEYLACGLPVITNSGVGDVEEMVNSERVGVVIRKFTQDEYSEKIKDVMELLREDSISDRCRKAAESRLSLDTAIDSYSRIYENLIAKETAGMVKP